MAVAIFAAMGIVLTISTLAFFLFYANTPIIKASSRELSVVLLLGLLLCYGNVFLVVLRPSEYSCAVIRFLYSMSYTVCYAAIFIKTNRIARIFKVTRKSSAVSRRTRYISPLSHLLLTAFIVAFQCILNTVWLVLRKPMAAYNVDYDYEMETITAFYLCEAFEDEDMVIALVLPFVLLIFAAIYAFKARKCPGKFNETKYIIITTYTTCVVWLAFIPVFFATKRIPVRVFALCAGQALNATVTLLCLFLPKLYVVICRPHKNTKDAVMGRKPFDSFMVKRLSKDSTCTTNNVCRPFSGSSTPDLRKNTDATVKSDQAEILDREKCDEENEEMKVFSDESDSECSDCEQRALSKESRKKNDIVNRNISFADDSSD